MQTREDIFWLIVAALALVGDYWLIRLAARDGRAGAWVVYGVAGDRLDRLHLWLDRDLLRRRRMLRLTRLVDRRSSRIVITY
jgi:hypothetical protein